MNLNRDAMLALQRHLLGALSGPARTWLEPLPSPPLVFLGDAIRSDGVLDFGSVASPGEERRLVRVCTRSTPGGDVRIDEFPSWLNARWLEPGGSTLEVTVAHDAEREFHGGIRFIAGMQIQQLGVRLIARRAHPSARLDFNGLPAPHPFDFGDEGRPYLLSIANATSVPLVVTFADLPDWLTFEVDGRHRSGPIDGPFFERVAPFAVSLRPNAHGLHTGTVHLRTNDPRPELQNIELQFAACVFASKPRVRVAPPPRVRLRADQTLSIDVRLENWGRSSARTSKESLPRALSIRDCPIVPAAHDGRPGAVALPIRITPAHLAPGAHQLSLSLRIEGGDPALVDVSVPVEVTPRRNPALRAETIAALFALLILTLLFVVVRGLS